MWRTLVYSPKQSHRGLSHLTSHSSSHYPELVTKGEGRNTDWHKPNMICHLFGKLTSWMKYKRQITKKQHVYKQWCTSGRVQKLQKSHFHYFLSKQVKVPVKVLETKSKLLYKFQVKKTMQQLWLWSSISLELATFIPDISLPIFNSGRWQGSDDKDSIRVFLWNETFHRAGKVDTGKRAADCLLDVGCVSVWRRRSCCGLHRGRDPRNSVTPLKKNVHIIVGISLLSNNPKHRRYYCV